MKTFAQILQEAIKRTGDYIFQHKGKWIIDTKHAHERMISRNELTEQELETLYTRAIDGLIAKGTGYTENDANFLFFSRSLKQGFVVDYRQDFKNKDGKRHLIIVTFLPRNKDKAKPGTIRIFVESKEGVKYSNFSQDFVDYIESISQQNLTESIVNEGQMEFMCQDAFGENLELSFYCVEGKIWDVGDMPEVIEIE